MKSIELMDRSLAALKDFNVQPEPRPLWAVAMDLLSKEADWKATATPEAARERASHD